MKARFQRALALLLVLVLTLGCIPAVSAVQPDEPVTNPEPAEEAAQLPEGSDLGAILQGNKDAVNIFFLCFCLQFFYYKFA